MKRVLGVLILISAVALNAAVPVDGFSEVVDKVAPAVVGITVTKEVTAAGGFDFEFDEEQIPEELRKFFEFWDFGTPSPQVPRYVPGTGSGVIFNAEGYVLTNNHVVEGANDIEVKLPDGREFSGKDVEVLGTDPETDLAVIKIKAKADLPVATLANSEEVKVGDWAIAIGSPYNLDQTVTVGVVSAKGRSNVSLYGGPSYQDFLQTDAAINPGNSGGPLCNIAGEVIGINTALRTNGLANSGIGFAIPSNMAADIAEQLIKHGKISRGYIGVYLGEAKLEVLEAMAVNEQGVFVTKVIPDSPAEKAGLEDGDLITSFAGEEITSVDQLRWLAASTQPGTKIDLDIIRDGKGKKMSLKLAERPSQEEMPVRIELPPEEETETSILGIKVRDISDKIKEEYGVKNGILVEEVEPGSMADKAGIMVGDVIVKVNKTPITNVKELKRLKGDLEKADVVLFQINRRGHTHFLTIRP
jgi:serine protease Do